MVIELGAPAGPITIRPWTPTFMMRSLPRRTHSRAVCVKLAWYRKLSAEASAPGVLAAKVAAPWRYSTLGHSMSAAAELLAGCGSGAFSPLKSPENKAFTLLANDTSDDCGAAVVDA